MIPPGAAFSERTVRSWRFPADEQPFRSRPIADTRPQAQNVWMGTTKFELAILALFIGLAMIVLLDGFDPLNHRSWYYIAAALIAFGMLSISRAYVRAKQAGWGLAVAFFACGGMLLALGTWLGLESYWTTPIDMNGHSL